MSEQDNRSRVVDAMCMTWRHDFGLDKREHALGSCGMTDEERDALRRQMGQLYDHHIAHLAARASLPVGVPDGWKLVPVSSTREQKNSVCMHPDLAAVLYSNMVKAAPTVKESLSVAPTVKAEQVQAPSLPAAGLAEEELWAVHAQGPDDLYPAFSRDDADTHAAALNSLPMPEGISVSAVVVPSPWPAVEHWKYLAEQERDHVAALSAQQSKPSTVTRDQIRDVFMRNGFTVKEGQTDLKPYVYAAAQELLALVDTRQSAHVSVPVGLLERIQHLLDNYVTHINQEEEELRALLASHAEGGKV